ncbi:glycosyltransferase family 2 protein [Streptomyces sp. DT2A-34]|uniref:glycosyltransferase family 2 protein n=1 Tax=Streptomyces sp. DT2A-34 TaxID=3051182 RepID=UPI00265C05D5|nr:glycosyltransferase family 2 protein [Streptomyces sp. DT2A-34]MDO0914932.1 glycosyltransferase family 2 protein [Streptomyces sp. DT2A-34]
MDNTAELPLVSVIIPNYNYGRTIGMCLESVSRQTYPRLEVIVVDDCSTDDSARIAREAGVTVLSTGTNSGVAATRNVGVQHASGEVLLFLDSDVALAPDAVLKAVTRLRAEPNAGAVCGIYEPVPLIRDSMVEECRSLQAYYWRETAEGTVTFLFPSICAMWRRVYDDVGPFDARLRQTEEVDYGLRLSQRYDLILTSTVRGTHDDDHELWPLARKIFTRGRLRVPLYARRRKFAKGFETASRAWGSLAALLAVPALLLPLLVGPVGWLVPAALLALSLGCDLGMYRYVRRTRGVPFLLFFVAVQFVFNLAVASGVVTGALHWLVSDRFRALYDRDGAPAAVLPAG